MILLIVIGSFLLLIGVVILLSNRKKKKKESELGIFHHPSNFKKPPIEWVQKPKDSTLDETTKKF